MRYRWFGWLLAAFFVVCTPLAYADEKPSLEDKAVELLDKVTGALEAAAQPAAEAVMAAVWFEGVAGVTRLLVSFLLSGIGIYGLFRCSRSVMNVINTKDSHEIEPQHVMPQVLVGLILFFLALIPGVTFIERIGNAYTWAALFNPPAAIALKLMNAL